MFMRLSILGRLDLKQTSWNILSEKDIDAEWFIHSFKKIHILNLHSENKERIAIHVIQYDEIVKYNREKPCSNELHNEKNNK